MDNRGEADNSRKRNTMIEKVNPSHPDKIADRIAGALVDLAYRQEENPRIAVEVLIGHGNCHIITETSVHLPVDEVSEIVKRIAGNIFIDYQEEEQDVHLSENQAEKIRCGDNGIFKGVPLSDEERELSFIARDLYSRFPFDGKFIKDEDRLIICQSNVSRGTLRNLFPQPQVVINPIGDWTGGTDVDTGATNRKLGSDMARSVTGGGLHGKDLSKADVSVNIYAFCKAQATQEECEFYCAIGDERINGIPYEDIVEFAGEYIKRVGGFEKFAEWGLF